ncbi:hypothetical protein GCM10009654_18270 [Streptomyces hebeiensis]|uniref:ABC transporter n=1 Tax=Streptomyces hebeiensis TaxID=229486 RepID=A0ABN1UQ50_9ACTN
MTALLGYQSAMLLRSQRWLPPVLMYGIFLIVGVQAGQPVLDALGYAAAALLPVTAWLVRICVTQEPAAARAVVAAASGPYRAHLAALLTATLFACGLGVLGTVVVSMVSRPVNADYTVRVPPLSAGTAGLVAAVVCLLLGAAAGALCSRPLVNARGRGIAANAVVALLALVAVGSPARSAVSGLVRGSLTGTVGIPGTQLVLSALVAAGAGALACAVAARRG